MDVEKEIKKDSKRLLFYLNKKYPNISEKKIKKCVKAVEKIYEWYLKNPKLFDKKISRKERNFLGDIFLGVLTNKNKKIEIFSPSCPAYSQTKGKYDGECLESGVSLTTNIHLKFVTGLLNILNKEKIPFSYIILTADQEIRDPTMLKKLDLDEQIALKRVENTVEATNKILDKFREKYSSGSFISTTFIDFFKEEFPKLRRDYIKRINELCKKDKEFLKLIKKSHKAKSGFYKWFFPNLPKKLRWERSKNVFAQYASLGDLISRRRNALIINHTTVSVHFYKDEKLANYDTNKLVVLVMSSGINYTSPNKQT